MALDTVCFQNVVKNRNDEVQEDNTPIQRLPLNLDLHTGGKRQEGCFFSGEAKRAFDKEDIRN